DTRPTGESGSLPDDIVESAIPSGFPLLADPPSAESTARFDEPPPAPLAWAGASGGPADQLDVSPSDRPTGGSDNAGGTTDSIGWAQVDPEPAPDNSDANDLSGLVASPQERDATDNPGHFDDTDLFGWESGDSGGAETSTREPSVEAATELFRSPTPTDDWQPLDDITAAGLSAALVGGINFESDPIEVGEDPIAADATADDLLEHSATEHAATEHEASGAAAGEADATGAEAVDGDVLDHHVHDLGPFDEAPDDATTDGDTTDGDTTDGDTLGNTPEPELNTELEAEAEDVATDVPAVEVEASADRIEPDQLVDGPDDGTDTAERDVIDHDEPTTAVVAADDRAVVGDSPMVLFPDDYPHTAESEAVRTDDDRSSLDDPTPDDADPDLEPAVPDTMSLFDDYVPSWVEPTPATEALPVQPGPEAEFISLEAMLAELPTASPALEETPVDAPVEASTN
ncbi:MAG: hypothetical protein KDB24_16995, partial [Microthrixaceae bacterium]|nr:hypothetical protein [Microthrixaceae bacterium]